MFTKISHRVAAAHVAALVFSLPVTQAAFVPPQPGDPDSPSPYAPAVSFPGISEVVPRSGLVPNQSGIDVDVAGPDGAVLLFDWKVAGGDSSNAYWFDTKQGGGEAPSWNAFASNLPAWSPVAVSLPLGVSKLRWTGNPGIQGQTRAVRLVTQAEYLQSVRQAVGSELSFAFPSRTLWVPVQDTSSPDGKVLATSAVGNGQTVILETTVNGPGILRFRWKAQGSASDAFQLSRNGVLQQEIPGAGGSDWADVEVEVPAGEWRYAWEFVRSATESSASNAAFLDAIHMERQLDYATWASERFSALDLAGGKTGRNDDFDGDGFSNLMEYAWGTNPKSANGASSRLPAIEAGTGGSMVLRFTTDISLLDVSYVVQASTNLVGWDDIPVESLILAGSAGSLRTYELRIGGSSAEPSRFYRVEVKESPN